MNRLMKLMALVSGAMAALMLAGCGERPQVIDYKQGKYQGKPDEKWADEVVDKIARAVVRAVEDAKEEKALTLHEGRETTVAQYRRYVMKGGTVRTNPGRNNPNVVRPAGENQ